MSPGQDPEISSRAVATFRLFISSTFGDLRAEREVLQRLVFPDLRAFCEERGARFQPIDLRWGVSEEAAQNQRTIAICLEEIARSQAETPRPNFLIILGERYGWRPLPYQIPASEFAAIVAHVADQADLALLADWYLRDENAVPAAFVLQPRQDEFRERSRWEPVEQELRRVLTSGLAVAELGESAAFKFWASATEQEISYGALKVPDAHEHVLCFLRTIEGVPADSRAGDYRDIDPTSGSVDLDSSDRLDDLKRRLRSRLGSNVREYRAQWREHEPTGEHLAKLADDARRDLRRQIENQLGRLEAVDSLDREVAGHHRFARERRRLFIGRESELARIAAVLDAAGSRSLEVIGPGGTGKSALMAEVARQARERNPAAVLVTRFIGATAASVDRELLLDGVCREILREYGIQGAPPPVKWDELIEFFKGCLGHATRDRPLVLLVDGLDQLMTPADPALTSAPADHVKVVVSSRHDLPVEDSLAPGPRLDIPKSSGDILVLGPLTMQEGEQLLDALLESVSRTLQRHQRDELLRRFEQSARSPLYLKMAFEEARRWHSYSAPASTRLSAGVRPLIGDNLFERLASPAAHGEALVAHALGYLAAARVGLGEDEILELLSADTVVLAGSRAHSPQSPDINAMPTVLWSRLRADLDPYLVERRVNDTSVLSFFHQELLEAAEGTYLVGTARRERHAALAMFFRRKSDPTGDASWQGSYRGACELTHHLVESGQADDALAALGSLAYLRLRLPAGAPDEEQRQQRHEMRRHLEWIAESLPPGTDSAGFTRVIEAFVDRGFEFISGLDYDGGKFMLITAVQAVRTVAVARPGLFDSCAAAIDRIQPFLRTGTHGGGPLFEGLRGEYSGHTLLNLTNQAFNELREMAGTDRAGWVADWDDFWSSFGFRRDSSASFRSQAQAQIDSESTAGPTEVTQVDLTVPEMNNMDSTLEHERAAQVVERALASLDDPVAAERVRAAFSGETLEWSEIPQEAARIAQVLEDSLHDAADWSDASWRLDVATMIRVRAGGAARRGGPFDWREKYGSWEATGKAGQAWSVIPHGKGFGIIVADWDRPDWHCRTLGDAQRVAEEIDARPKFPEALRVVEIPPD